MSSGFQRAFMSRMQYREVWTEQFAALLNGNFPEQQFNVEFYRLFVNGRSLRGETLNAITTNNSQVFAEIFVYMVTTATDKQRKRINKKLDKVIGDLVNLSNDD